MPRAFELEQQRARLLDDANEIHNKAEAENRSKSDEERAAFEGKIEEAGNIAKRIEEQRRIDDLQGSVDASGVRRGSPLPHNDPSNTRGAKHQYSLMKVIRETLNRREGNGNITGLEAETHVELEKRAKADGHRGAKGTRVPWDLGATPEREQRTGILNTATGVGSIPTILDTTIIDILRSRMVVRQAGARVMADMQGLFSIPRQNQAATAYWVSEGAAPTTSNQTIDQVPFSPKTIGAYTDYTRRFVEQTNQDAEAFVRDDLMAVIARGVDAAALVGSGMGYTPLGIANNPSISVVALGTNGAAPTYASVVGLETNVAVSNADFGALSYIMNAKGRSTLKQTLKVSGSTFPIYLWDTLPPGPDGVPQGMVNGYMARVTNQLPSTFTKGTASGTLSPILFGNWNDLIIALWSGLDIMVDPYTGSTTGSVRVVCLQDADLQIRHPESFSSIVDMITS